MTCYYCGECPDGEGSACRCNRYWTGNQCHKEENIEDCDVGNHYCLNNGQCISGLASCTCKRNYAGNIAKKSHQVRRIPSGEVLRKTEASAQAAGVIAFRDITARNAKTLELKRSNLLNIPKKSSRLALQLLLFYCGSQSLALFAA